jgi:hypothetical protein
LNFKGDFGAREGDALSKMLIDFLKGNHLLKSIATLPWLWGTWNLLTPGVMG